MPQRPRCRLARGLCIFVAGLTLGHAAFAEDDGPSSRTPLLPEFRQECGACHAPYPPSLLPAASWQRLMNDLPHHFGADASLDARTAAELSAWLAANAGTSRSVRPAPPQDRITRSAWFIREHREVSASTRKLPAVKSASNCGACHAKADQGEFNEHDIRVPR